MSKDEVYMRNTRSYARTEEKLKLFGCEPVPENEEVNYNIPLCSSILMTLLIIRIQERTLAWLVTLFSHEQRSY